MYYVCTGLYRPFLRLYCPPSPAFKGSLPLPIPQVQYRLVIHHYYGFNDRGTHFVGSIDICLNKNYLTYESFQTIKGYHEVSFHIWSSYIDAGLSKHIPPFYHHTFHFQLLITYEGSSVSVIVINSHKLINIDRPM